jgi:hypothetical protein
LLVDLQRSANGALQASFEFVLENA